MAGVDPMLPVIRPSMDDLGSQGMPLPSSSPSTRRSDDCAVSAAGAPGAAGAPALLALLGLVGFAWRQRRRAR
jgi:MYXO-CTERM domain-containing protein